MLDNTLLQPEGALCFLYAGLLTGLFYEVDALLRSRCTRPLLLGLIDGIFVLFMGAIFSAALFVVTGGALRAYAFFMTAAGFLLERMTLHRAFRFIYLKMIHKSWMN